MKDLTLIALVLAGSVPAKDLREFVALAKKEQERWSKGVRAAKFKAD